VGFGAQLLRHSEANLFGSAGLFFGSVLVIHLSGSCQNYINIRRGVTGTSAVVDRAGNSRGGAGRLRRGSCFHRPAHFDLPAVFPQFVTGEVPNLREKCHSLTVRVAVGIAGAKTLNPHNPLALIVEVALIFRHEFPPNPGVPYFGLFALGFGVRHGFFR
jgi:hypothetical protein